MIDQNLISQEELIDHARQAGFSFGAGLPGNRIRYWSTIGLIPHAVRRGGVGHYPSYTVVLLLKIQELQKQGKGVSDIKQILVREEAKLRVADVLEQGEVHKQEEFVPRVEATKPSVLRQDDLAGHKFPVKTAAIIAGVLLLFLLSGFGIYGAFRRADQAEKMAAELGQVLAGFSANKFLEFNTKVKFGGSSDGFSIYGGDVERRLTVIGDDVGLDQSLTATDSPSFAGVNFPATTGQIVVGGTGIITAPQASGTIVLDTATQTLTNKSISGSSNTFSNIPNSALSNSSITINTSGSLSGGGSVSLGSSISLSATDNTGVTATTSAGYIPIMTSGGTLGNSILSQNGIELFVNGTAGATGECLVGSTGTAPVWTNCGAASGNVWQRNAGVLSPSIITDSVAIGGTATASAKFFVDGTTGNVGIGTGSPSNKLHVYQNSTTYEGHNLKSEVITTNAGSGAHLRSVQGTLAKTGTTDTFNASSIEAYASNEGSGTITHLNGLYAEADSYSGTSTNLSGVHIFNYFDAGTVVNAYGLRVEDLYNSGASVTNRYGVYIGSYTGSATNNYGIYSAGATQNSYFAGGVGINTTAPAGKLDVRGSSGILPVATISGQTSFAAMVVDNKGVGDLFTASASGLNRFVITNAGNVGIGVTEPDSRLVLKSNTTNAYAFQIQRSGGLTNIFSVFETSAAAGKLELKNSSGVTGVSFESGGGANYVNTGTLGIGTTSPLGRLDVRGSSGILPVATVSGQTSFASFVVDNSGVGDIFTASASGLNRFVITNSGNVGIGFNTPLQKTVIAADLNSASQSGYLSTGNMLLGQNTGGAYFGGVGLTENQLGLTNYGNTWTAKDSNRNWASVAVSSNGKYQTATVGGLGGLIYVSSDYGNTWASKESSRIWQGVAMSNDGKYQTAVHQGGKIYVSSDYGNTWIATDSNRDWSGVAVSADGRIQTAVVANGLIYVSRDYGITWNSKGTSDWWVGVAMSSDGRIQTVTNNGPGNIYVSRDYGQTWSAKASSQSWMFVDMSADGKFQTAVILSGQIYTSSDYGENWTARDSSRVWVGSAVSADGMVQLASVFGGTLYVSTDYGSTWTAKGTTQNWGVVAMSSDAKVMTATTNGAQLYVSTADSYLAAGNLGVGTSSLLSTFDVRGSLGTIGVASISGSTSKASLVVDNTVGDLFTASSSGLSRFVITQSGNVGIGTTQPNNKFQVANLINFNPANNTILLGENTGALVASGANRNILLGNDAGSQYLSTGDDNIFIGVAAGYQAGSGAEFNTIVGSTAGYGSGNNYYSDNSAFGYNALKNMTTADDNTAVGYQAGLTVTTGDKNTFLGAETDVANGTISKSIAIGYGAEVTANNQLVIGEDSWDITDAYIGSGVITNAPLSVAINASGGSGSDIAGASLTLAGGKATGNAAGGSLIFSTSIVGNSGSTLQTLGERMRINSSGLVGINTTSPLGVLDVRGVGTQTFSGTIPVATISGKTSFAALVVDNQGVGDLFTASSSGLNRFVVKQNGNVGVGTTEPTAPFEVKGSGTGATIAKFTDNNTTGCTLATGGTISCSSDIRLKKNIENINAGLSELMALRPVEYNWKTESEGFAKSLGFIAQEVEGVLPTLVSEQSGFKQLNTIGLIPVLTKSIQQQQKQIEAISGVTPDFSKQLAEIPQIKDEISQIKEEMASQSARIAKVEESKELETPKLDLSNWTNVDMATIAGDLKVTGLTQLANTSIGGKLTVGLLAFDDLDADISSLGEKLSIQNGSVLIGKNGDITTSGKIEAKTVTVEKINVLGEQNSSSSANLKASIGTINIEAGETSKVIQTVSLTTNSKIFATPVEEPVAVSARRTGDNKFEIKIKEPLDSPITVNWWVVN